MFFEMLMLHIIQNNFNKRREFLKQSIHILYIFLFYHYTNQFKIMFPPRLCTVQGKVMVSPSALVRLLDVEMMVAMGEVAGVEETRVRRARGRPSGPSGPMIGFSDHPRSQLA